MDWPALHEMLESVAQADLRLARAGIRLPGDECLAREVFDMVQGRLTHYIRDIVTGKTPQEVADAVLREMSGPVEVADAYSKLYPEMMIPQSDPDAHLAWVEGVSPILRRFAVIAYFPDRHHREEFERRRIPLSQAVREAAERDAEWRVQWAQHTALRDHVKARVREVYARQARAGRTPTLKTVMGEIPDVGYQIEQRTGAVYVVFSGMGSTFQVSGATQAKALAALLEER